MKHLKRQFYRAGCLITLLAVPTGSLIVQATPAKADLVCSKWLGDGPDCVEDGKIGKLGQKLVTTIAGTVCTIYGSPAAGAACVAGAQGVIMLNNSSQGNSASGQTGQAGTSQAATSIDVTTTEWRAREAIEKLKQAGKTREAQIVADTLVKKTHLEQTGQTERAQIYTDALERMTNAKTEADLEKAKLALEGLKDNNQTAIKVEEIRAKVADGEQLTAVEIEKIRAETAKGLQLSQLEIAKINANAQKLNAVSGAIGNAIGVIANRPRKPHTEPAKTAPTETKPDNEQPTATTPTKNQPTAKAPADNQPAATTPVDIATRPSNPAAQLLAEWGRRKAVMPYRRVG